MLLNPEAVATVDFTSHGTPVAVTAGNLWFLYMLHVANRTNHKFPAAMPKGIPSEVKSTVNGTAG